MKKKLLTALMVFAIVLSMIACGKKQEETKDKNYADKDFIADLQKGLQARWDIADPADETIEEYKRAYTAFVNAELEFLGNYQNKKFEDSKLQELAIKYINCLKSQEEALEYMSVDSNKFDELWYTAYTTRAQLIEKFSKDYGLVVDDKYKDILNELLTTSKLVTDEEDSKKIVEDWIKTINFTCVTDSSGYKTYEAIVENTTGFNYEYVNLSINLIDSEGITVETTYSSFDNITDGAKIKFEFSTDKDFASTDITEDYSIKK